MRVGIVYEVGDGESKVGAERVFARNSGKCGMVIFLSRACIFWFGGIARGSAPDELSECMLGYGVRDAIVYMDVISQRVFQNGDVE